MGKYCLGWGGGGGGGNEFQVIIGYHPATQEGT